MKTFKMNNPLVVTYFVIKTFFICLKDLIKPEYQCDIVTEGIKKNKGTLYYSVVKYTNNTELVQYCNFYLPLEGNSDLCNVNDLLDDYSGITHDFVKCRGKLNCCVVMRDLDFMHLQNALNKKYGKTVKLSRIDESDSRI